MTLDEKLDELAAMAAILKSGGDTEQGVDRLIAEIHEAATLIAKGKLPAPANFRDRVAERLTRWDQDEMENAHYDAIHPLAESDERLYDPAEPTNDDEEPFGEPI